MPPPLLIDLDRVDLAALRLTRAQIYEEYLPHRHEFMVLDGVCCADPSTQALVAYADITPHAWWVRGHVPNRPLLPGVLMLEMAAQASAVGARILAGIEGFIGFGGVEKCKFRETVEPTSRLYLVSVAQSLRPRRIISKTQGIVDGRLVFEADITGLILP